ncbi:MAG: pyridoxamine 5'-phosphate oxidase family protein, partial [Kofleriaceae bacterium]|nr:pyridoxamine 5'-phosphate oxidase family protein [Kofleriaceae bacterium]
MKTARTQIRRIPKRANYDREQVYAILDAARICHLGFVVDQQPYVIPTIHTRLGDTLYLHGAPASRMLKVLAQGAPICVTVSHVDGLVLAKSAFHHSMNYRSAMVLGKAALVEDLDEKTAALRGFV